MLKSQISIVIVVGVISEIYLESCIEKFVRYELKEIKYQDSADALQHNKLLLMLKSVNKKPTPINDLYLFNFHFQMNIEHCVSMPHVQHHQFFQCTLCLG
jgi:hypothetical protein